jgi:hypothetical protein
MSLTPRFTALQKLQPAAGLRSQIPKVNAIVFAVTCLLSCPIVFAQMGQYAVYSDKWLDDSDPANVKLRGCGVTQDYANYYGHTYWVVTTFSSPNGRNTSVTSSQSSSYARAESYLLVDFNDLGTYNVQSSHWLCCPYMGGNPYTGAGCYPSASSAAGLFISLKKSSWLVIGEGPATCLLEATCTGTCVTIGDHHTANKAPGTSCSGNGLYFQLYELYADGQCWPSTRWGSSRMFEGECD